MTSEYISGLDFDISPLYPGPTFKSRTKIDHLMPQI